MKLIVGGCVIALITMSLPFSAFPAGELDGHLRFLEPLLGKEWVGGYAGGESPDIEIVLRFEKILDGRAVRYVREADAVGFSSTTQFFWNPGREEICFITLNNKGTVEEGVVHLTDGKIVLIGKSYRPDVAIDFKTTLEIDQKGTLVDAFYRMEDEEWIQGHLQKFTARE